MTGDDVVQQVVVPDAGSPTVARPTLLKAYIVDNQGKFRPLDRLEGMFEIPLHCLPPPFLSAYTRFLIPATKIQVLSTQYHGKPFRRLIG
jgi:hypothetical protein